MAYSLPPLGFAYDALEPHFDKQTMEIHHSKHHQTYVNNLNNLLKDTDFSSLAVDDLVTKLDQLVGGVSAVEPFICGHGLLKRGTCAARLLALRG